MVMMTTTAGSHEHPHESLQIKENDKFFSRLLSKENSSANSSCRVYYGGVPSAIPFTWESQPGTPKHVLYSDTKIPPLTPPPSYFSKSDSKAVSKHAKPARSLSWKAMLPKFNRKSHVTPTSSLPSLSSSSSLSWSSSPFSSPPVKKMNPKRRRCFSWSSSPLRLHGLEDDAEEEEKGGVRSSMLCFGIKDKSLNNRFQGCYRI